MLYFVQSISDKRIDLSKQTERSKKIIVPEIGRLVLPEGQRYGCPNLRSVCINKKSLYIDN